MTVWATEFGIALVLFAFSFPLALIFLVYHHYHVHGTFRGWSAVVTTLTFFYIIGVVAFTLFPLPEQGVHDCVAGQTSTHWQLIPLAFVGDIADTWRMVGFPDVLWSATFLQVLLNVVLLVPLGMLLAYRYRKSLGFTVLAGLGVSMFIEFTQGTGVWGIFDCPYRLADVDDLITNTAGAALGWMIATILARWLPDPTPPPEPDLGTPHVRRRVFAGLLDVLSLLLVGILVHLAIAVIFEVLVGTIDHLWFETTLNVFGTVGVAIGLFWVLPVWRQDRATPGAIATWLAMAARDGDHRASTEQITIRFFVRWSPVMLGVFVHPLFFALVPFTYESISVFVRSDDASLSGAIAHTTTVTRRGCQRRS